MAHDNKQRLIIFVKSPVAGKVKTRLAQDCSDELACLYYQAMVACALQHISDYAAQRQQPLNLYIGYTLSDSKQDIENWLNPYLPENSIITVNYFKQAESACLGERIYEAFAASFAQGYNQASIIGTDCIDITPNILTDLLSDEPKNTIGPTHDGGYYALGLNSSNVGTKTGDLHALFSSIRWSCKHTYADTLAAANSMNLTFATLPILHDIDYLEDWHRAIDSQQGYLLQQKLSEIELK